MHLAIRRIVFASAVLGMVLAAAGAVNSSSPLAAAGDQFDGIWRVEVTPDADTAAGARAFDDTLTFQQAKFTSAALSKRGFEPVAYEVKTARFGPATFTAAADGPGREKAQWTGTTMTGRQIEGTLSWTKKDGTRESYSFKGEKQ